jgi:predicted transcriptional regulator
VPKSTTRPKKTVPDRYRNALATFLSKLVADGRTHAQLAESLGITQSHVSQLLKGAQGTKGIGLPALLKFHEETKASLDEMLGIASDDRLARIEREIAEMRASAKNDTPPPATTVRRRKRQ